MLADQMGFVCLITHLLVQDQGILALKVLEHLIVAITAQVQTLEFLAQQPPRQVDLKD